MAIKLKPLTNLLKPVAKIDARDFDRMIKDCMTPKEAPEELRRRIAEVRLKTKQAA